MLVTTQSTVELEQVREGMRLAVKCAVEQRKFDELGIDLSLSPDGIRAIEASEFVAAMDALLMGKAPEYGLDVMHSLGVLSFWLPEVKAMVGFGDSEWRHKDVWKHSKLVVKQSVRRLDVRWGALLHDIGKPRTRRIDERGRVTFHGHAELGAAMFRRKIARRLEMVGERFERVHFLILHHLRVSQYEESWTDNAVRRFYVQMGEGLQDLLDLSRADITTKRRERKRRGLRQVSILAQRIRELKEVDAKVAPLPKGLGLEIMSRFGVPPSKQLGDIRMRLERAADEGRILGGQPIEYYVEILAEHGAEYGLSAESATTSVI